MNKVKLAGLAMVLPILALSGPAFAQSVPANVAPVTQAQGSNQASPQLIPTPGLSCTVSVGKPHYSADDGTEGEDAIDTHTYVKCNEPANSLQPVAYLYVLAVFGTSTYWDQMPAGKARPVHNLSYTKSPQSKDACTYAQSWWYGASGFSYINGGGPQNASNSYSNVDVACLSKYA